MVRFPAPIGPGDRIGVTCPSAGVAGAAAQRVEFCLRWLRELGFDVIVGEMMSDSGLSSGHAQDRAAELTDMLCDPRVRCVVPPWGGETAVDMLDLLDWERLARSEPTWLVGYSDISTILLAMTTKLGWATLHGDNLLDTPYGAPDGLMHWLEVAAGRGPHTQRDSELIADWWRFEERPTAADWKHAGTGTWSLHGAASVRATGRLIGGCIETISAIAGTEFGDVASFGAQHRDPGILVYLEAAEHDAATICRHLHGLRLAGWFEHARAILVGRTDAPDHPSLTQREAVIDALGRLDLPIVFDMEIGHVPPHLPLVNGATADLLVDGDIRVIVQRLH